jgi:hypothetical protein
MARAIGLAAIKLAPFIVGFVVLVIVLHKRARWRAFTAGALIGLVLGALAIGTCAMIGP